MPGFLLDIAAVVTCSHGGNGKPMVPLPRVTMGSSPPNPLVGEATPYVISGCPYHQPTVPPTRCPCTLAVGWKATATRVTAMGLAVLLTDSKATCIPNGVTTNVVPAQTRVRGT